MMLVVLMVVVAGRLVPGTPGHHSPRARASRSSAPSARASRSRRRSTWRWRSTSRPQQSFRGCTGSAPSLAPVAVAACRGATRTAALGASPRLPVTDYRARRASPSRLPAQAQWAIRCTSSSWRPRNADAHHHDALHPSAGPPAPDRRRPGSGRADSRDLRYASSRSRAPPCAAVAARIDRRRRMEWRHAAYTRSLWPAHPQPASTACRLGALGTAAPSSDHARSERADDRQSGVGLRPRVDRFEIVLVSGRGLLVVPRSTR